MLADRVFKIYDDARHQHLDLAGVQLDIDSPTASLPQYARFLHEVRKDLPPGAEISITALLDWFRDGTAISDVIKEADEFVPQFYDVVKPGSYDSGSAIAKKFDAARWAPKFNRFGKRYRIGISTFGRARFVRSETQPHSGYPAFTSFFNDVTPLDIGTNSAFHLQTTRSEAGELVLSYRAMRRARIGYSDFGPGDGVQFIIPTADEVRSAVESAKRMRGHSTGVVFFRWPASNETLTMQPDEVFEAADLSPQTQNPPATIDVVNGGCVAVNCMDVYLVNPRVRSVRPSHYRIRSSIELEYFLPEERIPIRLSGPSELELSLPPYSGRGRMYLGRAVTKTPAKFTVEEEQ